MKNKIVAVVGPTASGKTDLAVALCKKYGGEVISCDSMQIYRGMNIGTAKPAKDEMQGVPHHLVDEIELGTEYSVSDYVRDAEKCVEDLQKRGMLPVFCGGTGLYITSFANGLTFDDFENNPEIHERLQKELDEKGIEYIHERLLAADKDSADSIDVHNAKRMLRALEVYETTGITMTEWNRRSLENARKRDILIIGLDYENREELYSRINMRVDLMLKMGLLDETKQLIESGLMSTKTASQAIAYKEFVPYFNGEDTLENCTELLKRNSRRYAKRQLTWFRKNENIRWIFKDDKSFDEVLASACQMVEKYLAEE